MREVPTWRRQVASVIWLAICAFAVITLLAMAAGIVQAFGQ